MMRLLSALLMLTWALSSAAFAQDESGALTRDGSSVVEPDRSFSRPVYRERYQELLWVLRCPQCENQAIGDSSAPVSGLMRARVARLLEAGRNDDEIIQHMKERWGEEVTFAPGLGAHTGWILVVAVLGGAILFSVVWGIRRQHGRAAVPASGALSEAERERLRELRSPDRSRKQV